MHIQGERTFTYFVTPIGGAKEIEVRATDKFHAVEIVGKDYPTLQFSDFKVRKPRRPRKKRS